jgi:nucleoside-diphosphate-sugar epimerase
MRIVVTGAGGMIGRKLVARLLAQGQLGGKPITALTLYDVAPPPIAGPGVEALGGDIATPGEAEALAARRPDLVLHLAGVVSAEAEADFAKGYRVNLDGTRALLLALAASGARPRVVFASTAAVFGAPFPDPIPDDFAPVPLSSYGTQKLIAEALVTDFTRRGLIDGVSLRLPTICVRPGAPNRAASGFFSAIIREPLAGLPARLPVPRDVVHSHASPRAAVGFFLHAATMDLGPLGPRRALTLPGAAVSVAEQIEALRRVAGDRAVALIEEVPDEAIWAIVRSWPRRLEARRARDLGFAAETSFDEILRAYVEDELGGRLPA